MKKRVKLIVWWRKQPVAVRLLTTTGLGLIFIALVYLQRPAEDISQVGNNLLVFLLVNAIIVILCLLAFLIGRNVVKLIFDRRRNILGSKLRMRLVMAFVSLTLIPTVIIYVLASGLISSAMEGWFGEHMESVFNGAIEIARQQNTALKESVESESRRLGEILGRSSQIKDLDGYLEDFREKSRLSSIVVSAPKGRELIRIESATSAIENFREPELSKRNIEKALESRTPRLVIEENNASEFMRSYSAVKFQGKDAVLVVSKRIDPELSHAMNSVTEAYKEFEQVQLFKGPLKSAYLLTLAVITGLILFSAIWFGFYMARELSVPIQKLAEGTRAVSKGNYDFRVKETGDDEMSFLIRSFNAMTQDIKTSRREAESQRKYMETVLASLAVGVISLDITEQVVSINPAASQLFKVDDPKSAAGKNIAEIIGPEAYEKVRPMLVEVEDLSSSVREVKEAEIQLHSGGEERKILCTIGRVLDRAQKTFLIVLIFDDITELVRAQHMSAWREVARRVAHEIKNPLTPIQLSAQRLQKILNEESTPAIRDSTQTILENVDSIKRLSDEFSRFSRMPSADFIECDLNNLISSCIAPFANTHTGITFQFIADKLPAITADVEQIRRVVINLLDNAIAAVQQAGESAGPPRIVIRTILNSEEKRYQIEIADSGVGVPDSEKLKIFDPYYTTKKGGTGLGLAIVNSIISEHEGTIKVTDNQPQGAKFIVELPLTVKNFTQRKISSQV